MNILFINYGDFHSNSINHIGPYADELVRRGHACAVAVERFDSEKIKTERTGLYDLYTHSEIAANHIRFPNGAPADIVHAWTPRENVRTLAIDYKYNNPNCRLIIHLEENEDTVLESYYKSSIDELRSRARQSPDSKWHTRLSHPIEYKRFLMIADAITLITPSLAKLLPESKETLTINPIIDDTDFPHSVDINEIKERHRLPLDKKLIVYPGGITPNNQEDLRQLYLATHLLQQKGHALIIVKTGPSCPIFERSFLFPIEDVVIDLGYLAKNDVIDLIHTSDLLVHPGQDTPFNRDRFPCKIPEFFASGRPCILPEFYPHTSSSQSPISLVLKHSSPEEIASQIEQLISNPSLAKSIAQNAQAYARETYAPTPNADQVEQLYKQVIALDSSTNELNPILHEEKFLEEIKEQLRCNLETLSAERAQLSSTTKKLESSRKQIQLLEEKLLQKEDRNHKMQSSFSWKATSPLRSLRRTFLDPFSTPSSTTNNKKNLPSTGHTTEETSDKEPQQQGLDTTKELSLDNKNTPTQSTSVEITSTPEGIPAEHRCFIKEYDKFVEREEWLRSIYLDQYKHPQPGPNSPKISILLPVYNVPEIWLRKCIESVQNQVYKNWELCIADDASTEAHIVPLLLGYQDSDPRIKFVTRPINGHISSASNSAFELATGDYVALLDHDDELPPHALAKVVDTISQHPHAKVIYSDEDKIDKKGIRHDPHFKSDWNYDLLLSCNTISHLGIYRRDVFEATGGFRVGYEGAQDWDLAIRAIELCESSEIIHIPEILYHWRAIESSTALHHSVKGYAHDAQKRVVTDHLERIGRTAQLISVDGTHWRVRYAPPKSQPKVSIIIPTRDSLEVLSKCIESILDKTTYPDYEIIIVDNLSKEAETLDYLSSIKSHPRIKLLKYPSLFNYSAINNYAISKTETEVLCLLNNDTEVITPDWLDELVSHVQRPEVGVVGAKLLFPNDHIQQSGIVLGVCGIAMPAFRNLHKNDYGHVHRANLISQWSAVSGACMAFRRDVWKKVDGLDEKNLSVAFNDIDFCLRVREEGFSVILTPYSQLHHIQSATQDRFRTSEYLQSYHYNSAYMHKRWPETIDKDPFYNPNFSKMKDSFEYNT